jgi:hypothetical protein
VAQANQFGFDFVGDAVDGKWVAADLAPIQSILKGMEESGNVPGLDSLDTGQFKKFMDAMGKAWSSDVDVKRVGKDDAGDHFELTASARKVYASLQPVISDLGIPADEMPTVNEVPDEDYQLDIWVKDKKIERAEFDLRQLTPETEDVGPVALRIDLSSRPDGITIPKGVKSVNILELFGKFMSGIGGESPFGGGEDAEVTATPTQPYAFEGEGLPESIVPGGDIAELEDCALEFGKYSDPTKIPASLTSRCAISSTRRTGVGTSGDSAEERLDEVFLQHAEPPVDGIGPGVGVIGIET